MLVLSRTWVIRSLPEYRTHVHFPSLACLYLTIYGSCWGQRLSLLRTRKWAHDPIAISTSQLDMESTPSVQLNSNLERGFMSMSSYITGTVTANNVRSCVQRTGWTYLEQNPQWGWLHIHDSGVGRISALRLGRISEMIINVFATFRTRRWSLLVESAFIGLI